MTLFFLLLLDSSSFLHPRGPGCAVPVEHPLCLVRDDHPRSATALRIRRPGRGGRVRRIGRRWGGSATRARTCTTEGRRSSTRRWCGMAASARSRIAGSRRLPRSSASRCRRSWRHWSRRPRLIRPRYHSRSRRVRAVRQELQQRQEQAVSREKTCSLYDA